MAYCTQSVCPEIGFSDSNFSTNSLYCDFLEMHCRLYFPTKSSTVSSPSRLGKAAPFFFPGLPPCRETLVDIEHYGPTVQKNSQEKKLWLYAHLVVVQLVVQVVLHPCPCLCLHRHSAPWHLRCQDPLQSFLSWILQGKIHYVVYWSPLCRFCWNLSLKNIACPVPSISSSNSRCFSSPFLWVVSVEKHSNQESESKKERCFFIFQASISISSFVCTRYFLHPS